MIPDCFFYQSEDEDRLMDVMDLDLLLRPGWEVVWCEELLLRFQVKSPVTDLLQGDTGFMFPNRQLKGGRSKY